MTLTDSQRWGLGVIIALILQTFGYGYYMATQAAKIEQARVDIVEIKSGATFFLTRAQLEDILGGRDQRLSNIEATMLRLEKKFDQTFGK